MTGRRYGGFRIFLSVFLAFVIALSSIPSEGLSAVADIVVDEPMMGETEPVTPASPKPVTEEPMKSDDGGRSAVVDDVSSAKVVHVRLEPGYGDVERVADIDVKLDGNLWSLPKGVYAREGYEFVGWSTTMDGRDVADDTATVDVDESRKAVAVVDGQEMVDFRFRVNETDAEGNVYEVERDLSGYVEGDVLTLWAQWKRVEAPKGEVKEEEALKEEVPEDKAAKAADDKVEVVSKDETTKSVTDEESKEAKNDTAKENTKKESSTDMTSNDTKSVTGEDETPKDAKGDDLKDAGKDEASKSGKTADRVAEEKAKDEAFTETEDVTGKNGDAGKRYTHRLIVGMSPATTITVGTVLGKLDGAVLLGFEDEGSLEKAEALYKLTAEYVARDVALGASAGEDVKDVAMSMTDNPFAVVEEAATPLSVLMVTQDVLVGLLDTGAPADNHVVESTSVMGDDVKDANGHAGRMLDTMVKENENVRVMSVKVLDDAGHGTASSVYAGVMHAVDNGVKVINMSFAGLDTEGNAAIREAVSYALDHDVVVIAAAGNGGYDASLVTPANVEGVFTVGAVDGDGKVLANSNRGKCVDVFVEASSTSVAAARVSGQVSLGLDGWRERVVGQLGVSVDVAKAVTSDEGLPGELVGDGVEAAADSTVYWGVSGSTLYLSRSSGMNHTSSKALSSITSSSSVPWYSQRANITTVVIDGVFAPTSTAYWFYGCSKLTTFTNWSNLDVSNVTDMAGMFQNCSKLRFFPVTSSWDTSKVTNMVSMFSSCSSLTFPPDTSSWDTGNVTHMGFMFSDCSSLTSPPDTSSWNTSKVTSMYDMFYNCSSLTSPPVTSSWDTGNVTDMADMFSGCSKLIIPPVTSSWNTGNVTGMDEMFYNCSSLTSPPVTSSWNTGNVTDMSYMFANCSSLTSPPVTSSWNTGNVTRMGSMFSGCSKLVSLDVSSWDFSKLTRASNYLGLQGCTSLKQLKVPSGAKINTTFPEHSAQDIYKSTWKNAARSITGSTAANMITTINAGNGAGVWEWETNGTAYAVLDSNGLLAFFRSENLYSAGANQTVTDIAGNSYTGQVYTGFETANPYTSYLSVPWYNQRSSIRSVTIASGQVIKPNGTSYWFYGCSNLVSFSNAGNLDTSIVTNMSYMFQVCSKLVSLDISSWNFSKLTSSSNYLGLQGCNNLRTLKVPVGAKINTDFPEHSAQGDYAATWKNADRSITGSTAANMISIINAGNGAGTWEWERAVYTVKLRAPVGLGAADVVETVTATEDWSVPASPFTYANHDFVSWSGSDGKTYNPNDVIEANTFQSGDELVLTAVYEPHEYEGSDVSDNFVVTVPSAVNYVLKADGALIGPSNARIENHNSFAVRVSALDTDAVAPFSIVDSVGSSGTNLVSVGIGPEGNQLNIANYLTKSDVPSSDVWNIAPKANDAPGALTLSTDGRAHVSGDITSFTEFARLKWYFKAVS